MSVINNLITRLILETKQFDGNLQRSEKEMRNFQKEISSSLGKMEKGFTNMLGVVGKIAPGLGVAMGGIESFKAVINSTRTSQEGFNTVIEQAKTATDVFFQSVARADFSNFTNEMGAAIRAAAEYQRALGNLQFGEFAANTELGGIDVEEAKINNEIKKRENDILKSKDEGEKKRLRSELDDLKKQLDEYRLKRIEIYTSESADAEKAVREGLKVQLKTEKDYKDQVLDLLKVENREKLNEQADYYKKQVNLSKTTYTTVGGGTMGANPQVSQWGDEKAKEWLNSEAAIPFKIAFEIRDLSPKEQKELETNIGKWVTYDLKKVQESGKISDDEKRILSIKNANAGTSGKSTEAKKVETLSEKYKKLEEQIVKTQKSLNEAKSSGDTIAIDENLKLLAKFEKERDAIKQEIINIKTIETTPLDIPLSIKIKPNLTELEKLKEELSGLQYERKEIVKGLNEAIYNGDAAIIESNRKALDSINETIEGVKRNIESMEKTKKKVKELLPELEKLKKKNEEQAKVDYKENKKENEDLAKSYENLGNELSRFGSTISGISDNPALKALAFSLMVLNGVQQLAKSVTVWDYIAGAVGLAGTIVAFGAQMSNTKFAGGGVVGDQNMVRMNQGEMILNKSQQTRLFNQLNEGKKETQSSNQYEFVIRGENLVGVQKNYNSKFKR